MMEWTGAIWFVYLAANFVIGISYFVISFSRLIYARSAIGVMDFCFIFACGLGHFIHAGGMYFLAHPKALPWQVPTTAILFMDVITAGVSAFVAATVFKAVRTRHGH